MNTEDKKTLEDFTDRELLELIFTTVAIMNRKIERIENHLETVDKDYLKRFDESLEETISKIIFDHSGMESDVDRILSKEE